MFSVGPKPELIDLELFGEPIIQTQTAKLLGILFDRRLIFKDHMKDLMTKVYRRLSLLKLFKGTNWGARPYTILKAYKCFMGGGPRVVVSTAAFHARVRGSVPGLGGLKETKLFLPHPRVKVSIVGSLRDREVACSASDRQGSNFESCVWRTVSSQSSHHPQEVLLAQFSLYVHKGGLKPDSFHLQVLYTPCP